MLATEVHAEGLTNEIICKALKIFIKPSRRSSWVCWVIIFGAVEFA